MSTGGIVPRWAPRGTYALLAAAGLAISGFTLLRGIETFDEGIMLQAASRIASGELPYRDFLWVYGPAHPYLLAGANELVGPSLVTWRVVRTVLDAAIALAVFELARRRAGPRWALAAWLTAACAMAQPSSATPFPAPLLLGLVVVLAAPRRPVAAGLLAGAAAAWRLDFGIWAGVAAVAAIAAADRTGRERARAAAVAALAAAATALLVYLPFLLAVGPADMFDALVGISARGRQGLPFPFVYDGPLSLESPRAFAEDAKDLLGYQVPLLAVAGLVTGAVAAVAALRRGRAGAPWPAGLLGLGLGCLVYLLSRPDEFHATPLVVVACALLPAAAGQGRALRVTAAAVLALLLAAGIANRASALLLPPDLEPLDLAIADGVRVPAREARALESTVAHVHRVTRPGEPIYVATRRSDLLRINNPLFYVLANRPNAYHEDFGPLTTFSAQRGIVAALERRRVRVVVRWTSPLSVVREPNASGRPSGVRLLDRELAARWRVAARRGDYEVLVRRRMPR